MTQEASLPDPLIAALEQTLNGLIALDPEGSQGLLPLEGRILRLEWRGLGMGVFLIPTGRRIQLFGRYEAEPDCTLRGTPLAFTQLGLADHPEDVLFSGQIEIQGDTRLAQAFGAFLGGLAIDWEEQLARLTGDRVAHSVGTALSRLNRWGRQTVAHLTEDCKEALEEEFRLVPGRHEMEGFLGEVDRLRDDVERLSARVARLRKEIAASVGTAP